MEKEITISNNLNEITVLASFIEEVGEELSLSVETTMNINLALEEAVANIIMYAYPPQEQHAILLKVSGKGCIVFRIKRWGILKILLSLVPLLIL